MLVVLPGHAMHSPRRNPWQSTTHTRVNKDPRDDTEDPRDVQDLCDYAEVENSSFEVNNSSSEVEGPSL